MQTSFLLPIEFDLAATFLMAMTGVWVASRRNYDAVGALTLAFVSGAGGGLLRDSIFLVQQPVIMQNGLYLIAILSAVLISGLFYRFALRFERLVAYVDAVALGVYAVVGADKAMAAGIATLGAIVVGITNAVGGGLLRDIMVREEPLMFKPGQLYVVAVAGGCTLFVELVQVYALPVQQAALAAIFTTLLLRLLAIRFNWTTAPVQEWERQLRINRALKPAPPPASDDQTSKKDGD